MSKHSLFLYSYFVNRSSWNSSLHFYIWERKNINLEIILKILFVHPAFCVCVWEGGDVVYGTGEVKGNELVGKRHGMGIWLRRQCTWLVFNYYRHLSRRERPMETLALREGHKSIFGKLCLLTKAPCGKIKRQHCSDDWDLHSAKVKLLMQLPAWVPVTFYMIL